MFRFAPVACLLSLALAAPAAEVESARVVESAGDLAIREAGSSSWRIVQVGDTLPQQLELRTSAAGAVRIEVAGAVTTIGPDAQLQIDQANSRLNLTTGRVYVESVELWTVGAAGRDLELQPNTSATVVSDTGGLRVDLFSGDLSTTLPGGDSTTYSGPTVLTFSADGVTATPPADPDAWVAAEIKTLTDIRQTQGLGQLVVKDAQSGSAERMEIARCHVNVVLRPPVALVQLDQSFFNPAKTQQEGTFVFNLPPGASVSRFAMFVTPDELIEGELIERQRASDIYESIVRRRRDPAILEQIGDNLFRMRVFPIFARDTKRILLDFTVPLTDRDGKYDFNLPLMSDLKPIWDFRLSGSILPPVAPESVVSLLNPQLQFHTDESGVVRFSSQQEQVHPPQRLDLQYAAPQKRTPHWDQFIPPAGFEKTQYFVASIPTEPADEAPPTPADLMIVVDTSGSMRKLRVANQAARTLLNSLPADSRFQLACVDHTLRPLTAEWRSPTPEALQEAFALLDQQFPLGPTFLASSLAEAIQKLADTPAPRRRQLIYIGDGDSSTHVGLTIPPLLHGLNDVVISSVRTGDSQTGAVQLIGLARHTCGRVFRVEGPGELEDLFRWSLNGCATGSRIGKVRVNGDPDAETFTDPSFTPGDTLYVYGRCLPQQELSLTVEIDGLEQSYTLSKPDSSKDIDTAVFTGRLWAQRKLEALLGVQAEPAKGEKEQIVKLSQEWSLLSPFTAFLVLETEADYERWKINRQLRHRYWKPAEALPALPLPKELAEAEKDEPDRTPVDRRRRSSEAVLAEGLKAALEALEKNEPALAVRRLLPIQEAARQANSQEFAELLAEANRRLEQERKLSNLGMHRRLFDRAAQLPLPGANLLSSLVGAGAISPDFLRRHPDAPQMLKRVAPTEMSVREFAEFLGQQTDWNVIIDTIALTDVGISPDEKVDVRGIREMTVRNLMHHVLKQYGLTAVRSPHLVTITTEEVSDEKMETRVYPVVDLIRTDQRPRPDSLSQPYWDLDEAFRRKTEAALDRVVSVDLEGMTLTNFTDWLNGELKSNLYVDSIALADVGIWADREVIPPLKLRDVPLRVVADVVLGPLGLTHDIDRELVSITTSEIADELMETRLYSAVGVVYEIPRELIRERFNGMGGGFGGGFGGGGFGGGGLGGGGFGGGFGWGMGGGFGLLGDVEAGLSVIDSPQPPSEGTESANDGDAAPPATPASSAAGTAEGSADGLMEIESLSVVDSLQAQSEGQWEDIDGIGGTIDFYAPALALVVRQTSRVHREIAAELKTLRELPVAGQRVRPARFPVITERTPAGWDMQDLAYLIEEQTEGQWQDIDGIGGEITEHLASMSLMIRQTGNVHEEIDILLTQLRRAVIENRQRLQMLERGLPVSDLPLSAQQVNLTDWPTMAPPAAAGTDEELALLSVRQVPEVGTARWRHTSGSSVREWSIRHERPRLELETDDLLLRADGDLGAIRYPGLARVEVDAWGETIRQLAESALPWLPQVSNDRLAALFDVAVAAESNEAVTLKLTSSSDDQLRILATFDRQSGRPTDWQVFLGDALQYQLAFTEDGGSPTIRAIGPDEQEIERWDLLDFSDETSIAAVDEHGPEFLVVDRRNRDDVLLQIHHALEQYRYAVAITLLDKALERQPDQPLLNFLLAWTCEQGRDVIPGAVGREQDALAVVVGSGAADLIALVQSGNFPSADQNGLLAALKEATKESPSLARLDAIVDLSIQHNDTAAALDYQTQALETAGGDTPRRRMKQIDLLAANGRLDDARAAARSLSAGDTSVITLAELGDLFGRNRDLVTADAYFSQALAAAGDDPRTRSALLLRQATWHEGAPRWRLLAEVADATADRDVDWNSPLQSILREANATDADVLGQLAESVSDPAIAARLLQQQAWLTPDVAQAAELCRQLLTSGRVPSATEHWMLRKIGEAGDNPFAIAFLENRLRSGRLFSQADLNLLADFYEAVGNTEFAHRARRNETPEPPQPPARGGGFG